MIETERLLLREWKDSDLPIFAEINTSPQVQESFYYKSSKEESLAMAGRIKERVDKNGWGLWAVEIKDSGEFIGFTGLALVKEGLHFSPCTEIAWRLSPNHWNTGYATEAAKASLAYGFEKLNLTEIFSYTTPVNKSSIRIMEKIGMTYDPDDDFDHLEIPEGHPKRKMVVYRVKNLSLQSIG